MLIDALRYPTRGTPALAVAGIVVAMAIGYRYTVAFTPSILALVPAAVTMATFIALIGYLSRVLVEDDRTPPPIDLLVSLRSGFKSFGITIAFLAVPVILMITTIISFGEVGADNGVPAVFLVSSTAALFFFLATAYVLPAALAAATETDTIRAAFDREHLLPAVGDLAYVTAWTTGFALVVIGFIPVTITIGSADIAGLLSSLFGAYLVLASSRIIGTGYRRATGKC